MSSIEFAAAFLSAIFPAFLWLTIYYKKDKLEPEPKVVVAKTFMAGALMALPFLGLRFVLQTFTIDYLFITGLVSIFLFAALEEMAKLTASIYITMKHKVELNQVIDGALYAVTAALGFSTIENLFYFTEFLQTGGSLWQVALFRSLGTMLAHTLFSGIAGLIWAYAYFSKKITPFNKKHFIEFELKDFFNHEIISLHIIRRNILMAHPSRRGGHEKKILVLEGIFLATVLHALFNILTTLEVFGQHLTFLIVPSLVLGFLYISHCFAKKLNNKIYKVV